MMQAIKRRKLCCLLQTISVLYNHSFQIFNQIIHTSEDIIMPNITSHGILSK